MRAFPGSAHVSRYDLRQGTLQTAMAALYMHGQRWWSMDGALQEHEQHHAIS